MIPELGSFSLILALCLSALLGGLPIAGAHFNNPVWISMARPLTAGVFVFLGLAISALAYAFITDDFSVSFVAQHLCWSFLFQLNSANFVLLCKIRSSMHDWDVEYWTYYRRDHPGRLQ